MMYGKPDLWSVVKMLESNLPGVDEHQYTAARRRHHLPKDRNGYRSLCRRGGLSSGLGQGGGSEREEEGTI